MHILVAPSILSADFSKLGSEVANLEACGADYIHVDVMDGQFVPNLTVGAPVVKSIRTHTNLPIDVHLMVREPGALLQDFVDAGVNMITVHVEAVAHLDRLLAKIKALGVQVGVSICPATHENALEYVYHHIDRVLVMTVNPGYGGQEFIPEQLAKITRIKQRLQDFGLHQVELAVDGGINAQTAQMAAKAGANVIIAGHYIFRNGDYKGSIQRLKGKK